MDGKTSGRWRDATCTQTRHDTGNWWQVTLDKVYEIEAVTIYNRISHAERIIGSKIWVGMKDGEFQECATVTELIEESQKFECKAGLEGNVVKITQDTEYLTLCEVEVWGKDGDENNEEEDEDKEDDKEQEDEKEKKKKDRKEKKKKDKKDKKKKKNKSL